MPTTTSSPNPFKSFRKFVIVDDSTIRETRDKQEERKPRKRQRVEEEDDYADRDRDRDGDEQANKKHKFSFNFSDGATQRDPMYFKADPAANVYVRVGKTIFKIHEQLLSCSTFMADHLEEYVREMGPTSENKPVVLISPTLEEYRAFLWALYASADELVASPHEQPYVDRLYLLLSMTTKYDIPKLQSWAESALHSTASSSIYMESCSSASLTTLTEICIYHKLYSTLSVVLDTWCKRLEAKATPSVPAIMVADAYSDGSMPRELKIGNGNGSGSGGIKMEVPVPVEVKEMMSKLKGVAYYVHVQDMIDRQGAHTAKGALQLLADPKLNNGQVMRLLSGYWSLVSLWERLRLHPIRLPRSPTCSQEKHEGKCIPTWDRRWVSACGWKRIMGISSADVLGLLECLRDQLAGDDDLKGGLSGECRLAGLEALRELRKKTKEGLADHFFGLV